MQLVADRAFTSRSTLRRIEMGDHRVGMGIYASVMHALGLLDELCDVADWRNDDLGHALLASELPKRIHLRRPRRMRSSD